MKKKKRYFVTKSQIDVVYGMDRSIKRIILISSLFVKTAILECQDDEKKKVDVNEIKKKKKNRQETDIFSVTRRTFYCRIYYSNGLFYVDPKVDPTCYISFYPFFIFYFFGFTFG